MLLFYTEHVFVYIMCSSSLYQPAYAYASLIQYLCTASVKLCNFKKCGVLIHIGIACSHKLTPTVSTSFFSLLPMLAKNGKAVLSRDMINGEVPSLTELIAAVEPDPIVIRSEEIPLSIEALQANGCERAVKVLQEAMRTGIPSTSVGLIMRGMEILAKEGRSDARAFLDSHSG